MGWLMGETCSHYLNGEVVEQSHNKGVHCSETFYLEGLCQSQKCFHVSLETFYLEGLCQPQEELLRLTKTLEVGTSHCNLPPLLRDWSTTSKFGLIS